MGDKKYIILYPFSLIYRLITSIRNLLFDTGILTSRKFDIPIICVGNLAVGGTGKTPHTEYIVKLLRDEFRVAVLSRGYKRKSKGFIIAGKSSGVDDIGDEPLQIYRKFPEIVVAADANRKNGIESLLKKYPDTDVIILDDGFQHRRVKPGLSILLTDINRLFSRDQLMPYGRLRETRNGSKRADIICVTKSPDNLMTDDINNIEAEVKRYSNKKMFFTSIRYTDIKPLFSYPESGEITLQNISGGSFGVVLVTGIASPGPIKEFLKQFPVQITHIEFPDHHNFSAMDISKIRKEWELLVSPQKIIITTEKDSVRLIEFTIIDDTFKRAFYYLPVEIGFLAEGKKELDKQITDYVRKNKGNNRIP